jgi:hypothetical protein
VVHTSVVNNKNNIRVNLRRRVGEPSEEIYTLVARFKERITTRQ